MPSPVLIKRNKQKWVIISELMVTEPKMLHSQYRMLSHYIRKLSLEEEFLTKLLKNLKMNTEVLLSLQFKLMVIQFILSYKEIIIREFSCLDSLLTQARK